MRKVIFKHFLSPGDLVMMAYGIRSIHDTYPGSFLTDVQVSVPEIFEHNPLITRLDPKAPDVEIYDAHYPCIHESNQKPVRFVTGFVDYFEEILNCKLVKPPFQGILPLSETEKGGDSFVKRMFRIGSLMLVISRIILVKRTL
jgi:hypothetical protein